jgi:hypothetical protein
MKKIITAGATLWDCFVQAISNCNNRMISLYELPFLLNEASFWKLKLKNSLKAKAKAKTP